MKVKNIATIAMMVSIIILLGFIPGIPLGFMPIPIALQSMGIMLAGAILGSKRGFISIMIFLLLVAIGLPFLTGGRGGFSVFVGASVGYIIAYPFAAFIIGLGLEKMTSNNFFLQLLIVWISGVLFVDICGAIGLTVITNMPIKQALISNIIFIPGDTLKSFVVAIVHNRLKKMNILEY